ncbi:MAG: T9SS type A sorting domain-containing protein, partial [Bacteroidia bacterium]|nr:T9SS type A sorting domain-containing protein [Bacteroidia bacterium]
LDTVQSPVKICFTRFELLVPPSYPNYNLPPGLTLTGNPATLKFPGNANSCAIISGTPTTAGTYTLHFQVDVYGTTILSFQNCPTPVNPNSGSKISTQNIDYYKITIAPATHITETSFIQNLSLFPQPASEQLFLHFQSQSAETILFQLTDITGKSVLNQKFNTTPGENKILINISDIESGIYLYTITNNTESISNKLIIQH